MALLYAMALVMGMSAIIGIVVFMLGSAGLLDKWDGNLWHLSSQFGRSKEKR